MVGELRGWVGARVTDCRAPAPGSVLLHLSDHGWLHLEHRPLAKVQRVGFTPRNPKLPFSFQGLLRARLRGPLIDVSVDDSDRCLNLAFPTGNLVAHLFPGGGIWWVQDGVVVGGVDGPADPVLPTRPVRAPANAPARFSALDGSWLDGAAAWFRVVEAERDEQRWLSHTRKEVATRVRRVGRLIENLGRDLNTAMEAPRLQTDADGLASVLHTVPRGASEVDVPDFDGPDVRRVRLDPTLSASENLQRMYGRAGRTARAAEPLKHRLQSAREDLVGLEAAAAALQGDDPHAARDLARRLGIKAPFVPARSAPPAVRGWTTWRGPGGAEVWIGKHAEGNRQLVFRHARGRDLWLHPRGRPGSHAVIPAAAARSSGVVEAAIQLLLRTLRAEKGSTWEVQLARVADVRPVPDGAPGHVIVQHEKVRAVRATFDRLDEWTTEAGPRR